MALVATRPTAARLEEPVAVRLLPASDIAKIAPIWQELESRVPGGLSCSWAWTSTWLAHYGDLVPHWFALGERAGRPCGLALVTQGVRQKRGPIPVRTVHIGTAGEPAQDTVFIEYNRLLTAPRDRADFARGLLATIRAARWKWDELLLDGFVTEDAVPFLDQDPSFFVRREVCWTIDLAAIRATGGEVISGLRKNARKNAGRRLRAFGHVEVEWAETPEQAMDIFDEMVVLHQRRWTAVGQPGVFASERFTAFHRAITHVLLPRNAVILFRVRSEEHGTVGCLYGFVENGRVLSYQTGFGGFEDERLSPGQVSHVLCMQACLERGLNEYDFLMGDAQYKRDLSTTERQLIWAAAPRGWIKGPLLRMARRHHYGDNQIEAVRGLASQLNAASTDEEQA